MLTMQCIPSSPCHSTLKKAEINLSSRAPAIPFPKWKPNNRWLPHLRSHSRSGNEPPLCPGRGTGQQGLSTNQTVPPGQRRKRRQDGWMEKGHSGVEPDTQVATTGDMLALTHHNLSYSRSWSQPVAQKVKLVDTHSTSTTRQGAACAWHIVPHTSPCAVR